LGPLAAKVPRNSVSPHHKNEISNKIAPGLSHTLGAVNSNSMPPLTTDLHPFSAFYIVLLVSWLAYILTLKMEAVCSSQMSGCFKAARHYNSKDCTLQTKDSFKHIKEMLNICNMS
jgi:hypothetical protein